MSATPPFGARRLAAPSPARPSPARPSPGAGRATAGAAIAVGGVLAVVCALAAGCGSRPAGSPGPAAVPVAGAALAPLATSFADAAGAGRAIVEMGGQAAQEDNFWQLFVRPPGTARWRLATPGGVADNGGLEVAGTGGSLVTGFRPSQDLTFSPLAATSDDGASWTPTGPVNPGLADAPDALAAGPGGRLIALTTGGKVELGTGAGTAWTPLTSARALAASPAGKSCGLTNLTGSSFGIHGFPILAGDCSRPGTVGILADRGGIWRTAGPARLPGALAREDIGVLRLAATSTGAGHGIVALLRAGSGPDASLLAAWSGGSGRWTLSAPLRIGAGQLRSTSVGPGGAIGIILNGHRGESLAGPGSSWRALPALPAWAATLALGPGGRVDAIAAHGGTFADWRLIPGTSGKGSSATGTARWSLAQTIHVTIPYGSSG
jgi:hypothetical protein